MSESTPYVFKSVFTLREVAEANRLAGLELPSEEINRFTAKRLRDIETRILMRGKRTKFIYSLLHDVLATANQYYGYDINSVKETISHLTYGVGQHIAWHEDLGPGSAATRKLSASVMLSDAGDFDGGKLEFCPWGKIKEGNTPGSVIVFPSFMAHRVTPVTRGRRKVLVAWMHGKEFS